MLVEMHARAVRQVDREPSLPIKSAREASRPREHKSRESRSADPSSPYNPLTAGGQYLSVFRISAAKFRPPPLSLSLSLSLSLGVARRDTPHARSPHTRHQSFPVTGQFFVSRIPDGRMSLARIREPHCDTLVVRPAVTLLEGKTRGSEARITFG